MLNIRSISEKDRRRGVFDVLFAIGTCIAGCRIGRRLKHRVVHLVARHMDGNLRERIIGEPPTAGDIFKQLDPDLVNGG